MSPVQACCPSAILHSSAVRLLSRAAGGKLASSVESWDCMPAQVPGAWPLLLNVQSLKLAKL